MSRFQLFAATAVVAITIACSKSGVQEITTPTPATPQPPAPPVVLNDRIQSIEVGQVFRGTVRGDGAYCLFVDGSEQGPCDRFAVVAPRSGMLTVRVVWDDTRHFLGITVPRATYFSGIRCCTSPAESHIPLTAAKTTEFYVYFAGAADGPGGHVPNSAEQSYELNTSLDGP
jgi:hypothetical protein